MPTTAMVRNRAFWAYDRISGSPMKHSVDDVMAIRANPRAPGIQAFLAARRTRILSHVVRTVPYYSGCDPHDLQSFPVVRKAVLREGGDAFLSTDFRRDELVASLTSGSTGTPFGVLRDRGKVRRNHADTLAMAQSDGYRVGMPIFYLHRDGPCSRLRKLAENVADIDVGELRTGRAAEIISRLRRTRGPVAIVGYASAVEALCREVDASGEGLHNVRSLITGSEAPSQYLHDAAPRCLGRQVAARYSGMELGIMAQQDAGAAEYRLNLASFLVEVLALDHDGPAAPGELGRIVVTDLFNRGMAFIRYDTCDLGRFAVDDDGELDRTVLKMITGRINDQVYDTADRLVPVLGTVREWSDFPGVFDWQFVQVGSGRYLLKQRATVDPERDRALVRELRSYLGEDAEVEIRYVDDIPLLPSGKRRAFANEWAERPGVAAKV